MKLQEKIAFARQNPVYEAIPLVVLHKAEKKKCNERFMVPRDDLTYHVSSPSWMKCRLLLFWILWAALIMAMIISVLTFFCLIPRTCHNSNTHREHEHEHKNMNMNRQ
ncbi:uncharacterized protein [Linepithema humile]|uniref:uncharacterized protein n=1 Tax=Linepithema humile TaxID=83485 RepID=UPI00351EC0C3